MPTTRLVFCMFAWFSLGACASEEAASQGAGMSGAAADDDGGGGDVGDPDEVDAPFARACERLHDECEAVCDNVFVECYDDVATCTEQWSRDYLADYVAPIYDDALVARCAEQVDEQSCTDLRPDTAECEYAVVDGCPGDDDAHGPIYSPFRAGIARVGEPIEVYLCDGVEEYFEIELTEGTRLELVQPDDAPGVFVDVLQLTTTAVGDVVVERGSLGAPIARDGTYVLELSGSSAGRHQLTLVRAS